MVYDLFRLPNSLPIVVKYLTPVILDVFVQAP